MATQALIYDYYASGERVVDGGHKVDMYSYKCNYCVEHKLKGYEVGVKAAINANSNLHNHLNRANHASVKEHYEKVIFQ